MLFSIKSATFNTRQFGTQSIFILSSLSPGSTQKQPQLELSSVYLFFSFLFFKFTQNSIFMNSCVRCRSKISNYRPTKCLKFMNSEGLCIVSSISRTFPWIRKTRVCKVPRLQHNSFQFVLDFKELLLIWRTSCMKLPVSLPVKTSLILTSFCGEYKPGNGFSARIESCFQLKYSDNLFVLRVSLSLIKSLLTHAQPSLEGGYTCLFRLNQKFVYSMYICIWRLIPMPNQVTFSSQMVKLLRPIFAKAYKFSILKRKKPAKTKIRTYSVRTSWTVRVGWPKVKADSNFNNGLSFVPVGGPSYFSLTKQDSSN